MGVKSRNNASVELNLLTETGTVLGNSLLQKISLFLKHIILPGRVTVMIIICTMSQVTGQGLGWFAWFLYHLLQLC